MFKIPYFKGEVYDDILTRVAYSSDASIYEIVPRCVALPKDREDVVNVVRFANSKGIPIIARGGGSGLVGGALGDGIILDFTKYMNKVLNIGSDYVEVEPGIYKGVLDRVLARYNKFLPVDPSSSEYCTIGGMIATNASGTHTLKYGSMIDYVLELEVVLADGTTINAKPIGLDKIDDSKEGRIARYLYELLKPRLELINKVYPKVSKNSCGYRLDRVLNNDVIELQKLFVGSEGTLGIITKAKLRILDIPDKKCLVLLGFKDTKEALTYIKKVLRLKPSALEFIDKSVIDIVRLKDEEFSSRISNDVNSLLFVEFEDLDVIDEVIEDKACIDYSTNKEEIDKIWSIRKKALAYIMKIRKGNKKPIAFIEDLIVEPNKLGSLLEYVSEVCNRYSLEYVAYGHAGDGNLHLRPFLDIEKEYDLIKEVGEEILSKIIVLNGSISAEHGDGIARSHLVKGLYGEEIYSLFVSVKRFLDPNNIMNPGKKVDANILYSFRKIPKESSNILNWSLTNIKVIKSLTGYDEYDYSNEVYLCHGCGGCRELNYSTRMCPVYKALNIEEASCRGRNNILRWLLNLGKFAEEYYDSSYYKDVIYKYCIQCKMCLIECPSNVNVGKIMAEARARYAKIKGLPKGYKYFIDIDRYAKICSKLAPLSNLLMNNGTFRIILEKYTNIDRRKRFPKFSRRRFKDIYEEYRKGRKYERYAAFFYDTYINYNDPNLGLKIAKILERYGYGLILPDQLSSGLPALLEGDPDKGRKIANYNIENLYKYAKDNIPIITFSPSSYLALKLEYLNVIDNHKSRLVADNTFDIYEFLARLIKDNGVELASIKDSIGIHFHCHTLVLGVDKYVKYILDRIPSLSYHVIEKGCCGTGGSYSFIKDNYDLSMLIGRELFNAIRNEDKVYTTGESCKLQMEEGSGKKVDLVIDLIADAHQIRL